MSLEIERKFLVKSNKWKESAKGVLIMQGYLSASEERIVRIRIAGSKAFFTIKGLVIGISRLEYEYEIPHTDALEILNRLCIKPIIEKHRYKVVHQSLVWEIDEFHRENEGLIIAEIELDSEDQKIDIPDWIGEEVTGDKRYYNSNLLKNPYSAWK